MSDRSKIEWTDATWNPVTGCTKVSDGCKYCYAKRMWPRLKTGRPFTEVQCHPERLDQPLRWRKPRKVFVCSMSDLFNPTVPFRFVDDVMSVIHECKRHTFQVLTKRPECALTYFTKHIRNFPAWDCRNLWLGVSVEDQATADERIPLLLQTPAAVRFVSYEPALGPVDFSSDTPEGPWSWLTGKVESGMGSLGPDDAPRINWVICGGESGPKARPMHPDWARSVRDQCVAAEVPFMFKQWGEWAPVDPIESTGTAHHGWWELHPEDGGVPRHEWPPMKPNGMPETSYRVGKRHAGREIDGKIWDEYPK